MNIKKSKKAFNFMPYVLLCIVIIGAYFFLSSMDTKINELSYSDLTTELNSGNVTKLTVTPRSNQGVYVITGQLEGYKKTESFNVTIPYTDTVVSTIYDLAESKDLKVETATNPESSTWLTVLINVVPFLFFGIIVYV